MSSACVSKCTFVLVKQVNCVYFCTSLCTFVLVKQVNCVPCISSACETARVLAPSSTASVAAAVSRQYLYFCTGKASKLRTLQRGWLRQVSWICVSVCTFVLVKQAKLRTFDSLIDFVRECRDTYIRDTYIRVLSGNAVRECRDTYIRVLSGNAVRECRQGMP